MTSTLIPRLFLPAAMATALLLSLAYWWLENLAHELFGTVLFALLAWHIAVNRLWFKNIARGRYDTRRVFTVLLHLLLSANMLVLLVTSVAISKSVFAFLPVADSMLLREIHWFSAYWIMMAVGIHLGLHWARVMGLMRTKLGLSRGNFIRLWALRAVTLVFAALGLWSFTVLGVWGKLTFTYSLEFWDFTASVSPFFGHWAAVLGLPAIATYYFLVARANRRPTAGRRRPVAPGRMTESAGNSSKWA